eukprot:432182-Pyramimonas_sp.AAC.1
MQFQRKAFQSGASIAHRVTKVRPLEPVVAYQRRPADAQPQALANRDMRTWVDVWTHHGCLPVQPPLEAAEWPALPKLDAATLRK